MASFGSMTIYGNDWDCSQCQLIDYMANSSVISPQDEKLNLCAGPPQFAGKSIQSNMVVENCRQQAIVLSMVEDVTSKHALIGTPIGLSTLFLAIICLYWKRQEVIVLLYIKYNIRFFRHSVMDSNSNYRYDAFISFNDHLYSFVNNELRNKLENGDKKYRYFKYPCVLNNCEYL